MTSELLTLEGLEVTLRSMHLPFQPQVLSAILQLREDTRMNFGELDRLIRVDQNIASLVLKVANSSFYSRGQEIRTLPQAIGMIGFRTIVSLVSAVATKEIFRSGDYARFKKYVWQHSLAVSIIGRILSEKLGLTELKEEVFIGGLLHDIGKVVLNQIDRRKFIAVLDQTLGSENPFGQAELEHFGVDHASVGQLIIKIWNLPLVYREVTVFQNSPGNPGIMKLPEKDRNIIHVVGLANLIAKIHNFGHAEKAVDDLLGEFYRLLRIGPEHEIHKIHWPTAVTDDPHLQMLSMVH